VSGAANGGGANVHAPPVTPKLNQLVALVPEAQAAEATEAAQARSST
jgi:hypothetical protein